ncbi:hypothetical protein J6590_085901 [Homalodisca vitripennis]|nr:hypothetical protein J6590_085901 [Homalodisca vitripennis]
MSSSDVCADVIYVAIDAFMLLADDSKTWSCGRDDCINFDKQTFNQPVIRPVVTNNIIDLTNKLDTLMIIPRKIDQRMKNVDSLKKNLSFLESRVSTNEETIRNFENKLKSEAALHPENLVAKLNDLARRASCLIVYGLPESKNPNVDERKKYDTDKALFGNVYIPPDQPPSKYQNCCDAFDDIMNTAIQLSKIIIVGDLSTININWNNLDSSNFPPSSRLILDFASSYDLTQMNIVRNFRGVYLDLVLSTDQRLKVERAEDPLLEDRH